MAIKKENSLTQLQEDRVQDVSGLGAVVCA